MPLESAHKLDSVVDAAGQLFCKADEAMVGAKADAARSSRAVLQELQAAERDMEELKRGGSKTSQSQRLLSRKINALEDEYMEAVQGERGGKRSDAAKPGMSGSQLTRHGEELAREKKRLTEKLRAAKSKGDEDRAKSELTALRKQIDEWHRETTRGDADNSVYAVRRVKDGYTLSTWPTKAEAESAAEKRRASGIEVKVEKDTNRKDADYRFEAVNKAIAAQNRSGRGKVGGREGKMIHALLKGNEGYALRSAKKDTAPKASGTTVDQLISDAEQLFGRADAMETGRWDSVADALPAKDPNRKLLPYETESAHLKHNASYRKEFENNFRKWNDTLAEMNKLMDDPKNIVGGNLKAGLYKPLQSKIQTAYNRLQQLCGGSLLPSMFTNAPSFQEIQRMIVGSGGRASMPRLEDKPWRDPRK